MIDLLFIVFFSCLSAGISYMLDYGLGKPGSEEISVNEFLSGWTFALAKRRLIELNIYDELIDALAGQSLTLIKKTVIEKAKEYFTWEKAAGMCIICCGFWVALILSFIFTFTIGLTSLPDYLLFSIVPFSHFILRKI